ncbi:hypothetical protein ASPZODRAFT_691905 [Penicilliopsis zonata CBS 506.65]|uniref:Uncharacterized protein n=1 Tax=Penicilliopsis zonata CBS 506.65 TaxID=1073090 RepID=A0A1L9SBK1_9EURO|nr:hypothetical protein ASPZODRAFT_691905 [Penicilliopsis zonata CBS 506.65]OJJ44562.1 hypothetical protein ASPZODRAFT_691905 [Penicilliopsis zonata CBS 506.65]
MFGWGSENTLLHWWTSFFFFVFLLYTCWIELQAASQTTAGPGVASICISILCILIHFSGAGVAGWVIASSVVVLFLAIFFLLPASYQAIQVLFMAGEYIKHHNSI